MTTTVNHVRQFVGQWFSGPRVVHKLSSPGCASPKLHPIQCYVYVLYVLRVRRWFYCAINWFLYTYSHRNVILPLSILLCPVNDSINLSSISLMAYHLNQRVILRCGGARRIVSFFFFFFWFRHSYKSNDDFYFLSWLWALLRLLLLVLLLPTSTW